MREPNPDAVSESKLHVPEEHRRIRRARASYKKYKDRKVIHTVLRDLSSRGTEHFGAQTVHGETAPGDHSLSSVRSHLEGLVSDGHATRHEQGAGRAKFVGYRSKDS